MKTQQFFLADRGADLAWGDDNGLPWVVDYKKF